MATDWTSPERQKKEYMTYTVNFEAKNTKNVTMNYILEGEGKYVEQQKEIQTKTVNGEEVSVYVRSAARDVWNGTRKRHRKCSRIKNTLKIQLIPQTPMR